MVYFRKTRDAVSKLTTPGRLYFIQGDGGGLIKIGWATDPKIRMAHLQAHSPARLVLLHSEPGNGKEEAELHKRFAPLRRHGEWFEPGPALLAEIVARRGRNHEKLYEPGAAIPEPIILAPPKPKKRRSAPDAPEGGKEPDWYAKPGTPEWERYRATLNTVLG